MRVLEHKMRKERVSEEREQGKRKDRQDKEGVEEREGYRSMLEETMSPSDLTSIVLKIIAECSGRRNFMALVLISQTR
jgi:hypothetical protein